ncbi:MAG: CPBP family intramembrane glutamic endopeptidase [Robiginitalea sp.]|jgi:membrane protease YdiL (CAAX protease family)
MKMGIEELLLFLRNPEYRTDVDQHWKHKLKSFAGLLVLALGIGFTLALFLGVLDTLTPWELEQHAFEELLDRFSVYQITALAILIAPVVEELVFRGPLWFFRKSRYFKWVFWFFTLLFALIHLGNYQGIQNSWYLAPLLVSPQLTLGIILGFVRVKFGLYLAMAFHAAYNAILLGPILLLIHTGLLS